MKGNQMVGTGRFELPTPRTPSECSTRLSHVPTRKEPTASIPQRMGFTQWILPPVKRFRLSKSYPMQDEPEGERGFQHKMSLKGCMLRIDQPRARSRDVEFGADGIVS